MSLPVPAGDPWSSDVILRPGGRPPMVIPFCAQCLVPVEKFTLDPITSPFRMGIQAQCHGQTEGTHVTVDQLFGRQREGVKVVMFRKRAGANTVR